MSQKSAAAYAVLVVARDGRCLYSPNLEGLVDSFPWELCWDAAGRATLREAFIDACMFRRRPRPTAASLRIGDRSYEFIAHLEPTGPEVVICRLVRVFSNTLSSRERDVLTLVAGGADNGEIARVIGAREGTIRSHLRNIREKLGVSRPEGLLLAAVGIDAEQVQAAVNLPR
ncbi:MAG: LuxR C-terminal-related transcriptional regulator [Planctomycetota bacterium]